MPTKRSLAPHGTSRFTSLVDRLRRERHQADVSAGRSWRRPHWVAVVFSALLLMFAFLAVAPFVAAHLQAAAVLNEVAGQPVTWALRIFAHHHVTVSDVTLPDENGNPIHARLYLPDGDNTASGMVVLHGVHHLGMHEPRLIAFAQAMASCGLRVLTPELPGIADYHVTPESIRTIGNSAVWLARANPNHDLQPVSVLGLSFSGGLSLLAAADPVYHPAIRLVVTVGSQDEMSRVAAYYRTGSDEQPNGTAEVLPPHEYGALVLEYEHLGDFVPAADLTPLRALLRAHLYEDVAGEKSSPRPVVRKADIRGYAAVERAQPGHPGAAGRRGAAPPTGDAGCEPAWPSRDVGHTRLPAAWRGGQHHSGRRDTVDGARTATRFAAGCAGFAGTVAP